MATVDDYRWTLADHLTELVEENSPDSGLIPGGDGFEFHKSYPEAHRTFDRLMALVRADAEHFEDWSIEWEDSLEEAEEEGDDSSFPDFANDYGSGYFEGFQGETLRELYDFEYSADPVSILAQSWHYDGKVTLPGGITATLFSHGSYKEHDSWALLEDPATGEVRHQDFSWV